MSIAIRWGFVEAAALADMTTARTQQTRDMLDADTKVSNGSDGSAD